MKKRDESYDNDDSNEKGEDADDRDNDWLIGFCQKGRKKCPFSKAEREMEIRNRRPKGEIYLPISTCVCISLEPHRGMST